MSNLKFKTGNLLNSKCHTLVNTVNCVGVMGKGIALEFKRAYPDMFCSYKEDCKLGKIKIGKLTGYHVDDGHMVLCFPTKEHWRNSSEIDYIMEGLEYFVKNYKRLGVKSVAFPKLGCANGGLDWPIVRDIMIEYLGDLDIAVEIYE